MFEMLKSPEYIDRQNLQNNFDLALSNLELSHIKFEKIIGDKYEETLSLIIDKVDEQVLRRTKNSKALANPIEVAIFTMQLFDQQFQIMQAKGPEKSYYEIDTNNANETTIKMKEDHFDEEFNEKSQAMMQIEKLIEEKDLVVE